MPLTNEQLFDLIKDGNEELKPVLWERVKNLLYSFCGKLYRKNIRLFASRGLDECDLRQISYLAYHRSFDTYSTGDCAYSTALHYTLHNEIRRAFGKDTDQLNRFSESLDSLAYDESDTTLAEITPDPSAEEPFQTVEDTDEQECMHRELHKAVKSLPEDERNVIKRYFFEGKTAVEVAAVMGVSSERVRQIRAKALRHLRNPKITRRLSDVLGYGSSWIYKHTNVEYIAVERVYIEQSQTMRAANIEAMQNARKSG